MTNHRVVALAGITYLTTLLGQPILNGTLDNVAYAEESSYVAGLLQDAERLAITGNWNPTKYKTETEEIKLFRASLKIKDRSDVHQLLGIAYLWKGHKLKQNGSAQEARKYYKLSLEELIQKVLPSRPEGEEGKTFFVIGDAYDGLDDCENATPFFKKSILAYEREGKIDKVEKTKERIQACEQKLKEQKSNSEQK